MNLRGILGNRASSQLQDVLLAHADALVRGEAERDVLLAHYDATIRDQAVELMDIAERIQNSMPAVRPSERFVAQLGHQLAQHTGDDPQSLWERIRDLPPGMQLAAGIGGATITAGLVLIASRTMPNALSFWRNRRVLTV